MWIFLIFIPIFIVAEELPILDVDPKSETIEVTGNRIDLSYAYTKRTPKKDYTPIQEGSFHYFKKMHDKFTLILTAEGYDREKGQGFLGGFGGYLDVSPTLYTFSSLKFGTNQSFLPSVRLDHDFYFKFGETKSFIIPIGMSYINWRHGKWDLIGSSGFQVYWKKFIFSYRLFLQASHPGKCSGLSQKFTLLYGQEKISWSTLDISFGKQGYLATYLDIPEKVNSESFETTIGHRHWVRACDGIFFKLGYGWIKGPCQIYRGELGYFYEF